MFLTIIAPPDTTRVTVHELDDLKQFHVNAIGLSAETVDRTLREHHAGRLAETPADHCWVDIDFLTAAAAANPVGADWPDRFADMLAYARTKGWVDAGGTRLLGHLERSAAS